MNRDDPFFDLYRETVSRRPSPADPHRMADGPTAAFAALELERERWALVHLLTDDEAGAA